MPFYASQNTGIFKVNCSNTSEKHLTFIVLMALKFGYSFIMLLFLTLKTKGFLKVNCSNTSEKHFTFVMLMAIKFGYSCATFLFLILKIKKLEVNCVIHYL